MEREHDGDEAAFWLRHTHVGIALGGLGLALVLIYAAATPDRPGRAGLLALVAAMLLADLGLLALPLRRIVADVRGRARLFRPWTASTVAAIALGAVLDGGADSPLWWLALLVLIHSASIYTPAATVGLGTATTGVYALVAWLGPSVAAERGLVVGGVLAMVTLLAALTSGNIWGLYRRQQALARRLAELADRDGLTGCLNHRAFHERLHGARSPCALLLLDLDHFKAVNDTHGHLVGDAVLAHVAATVRGAVGAAAAFGRLGGEEFALLLPGADRRGASAAAERVRRAVAAAPHAGVPVTVSVGLAVAPADGAGPLQLLVAADAALYAAKRAGRNRVGPVPTAV